MSNNNKTLIDLQNYIQQKHGFNVHITKEFKNALDNLSALVSELNNGSINKLKNMCSSGKKSAKKSTKKINKNQIRLKLKFLQKKSQKKNSNDDPELKELIDLFAEKNDIIAQLLHPDNREILDAIFDELELSGDTLLSSILHDKDIKELISATEKHDKIENELEVYSAVLTIYGNYASVLQLYDTFDQAIMRKYNSSNKSIDKLQRQMISLKKACEDNTKKFMQKMTEKTQAKNHQIQVIFKCKSILKPKIEKEIPDLKQKYTAEITKLHSIKTRFDNDANSITEDEFKECLDNIYNYQVLHECYFFINNELPNPISIFMTDMLKHKYYEEEQKAYEAHLDYLNKQKPELIITNLVRHYNDH